MNSFNVYRLHADVTQSATYQFDAYEEMDYWDDYLAVNFRGKPLPSDWKMPKYELGAPRKPLHDFVHGEGAAPFVNDTAKHVLEPVVSTQVQFWPMGISLTGVLLNAPTASASAVQSIQKNMEEYLNAKQKGEPTSDYSSEVALGYYEIFCNQLYFYATFYYLENGAVGELPNR